MWCDEAHIAAGKYTKFIDVFHVRFSPVLDNLDADLGGGNYYPLELEYVAGGTSTASAANAGRVGWMYMNNTGDADGDFDDNGVLFDIEGLTAGSGHLWDTTASAATGDNTIKIKVNGTIKYLLVADDAS